MGLNSFFKPEALERLIAENEETLMPIRTTNDDYVNLVLCTGQLTEEAEVSMPELINEQELDFEEVW